MNELFINLIGLTVILIISVVAIIISEAWAFSCDYVHDKHFTTAKKLNRFEKFCDGFKTLLKM